MPPIRVYADTSVYGGCFDSQFSGSSVMFFEQVRSGRFLLVASALVESELEGAPPRVRELFASVKPIGENAVVSQPAIDLQSAYLAAGIVSERSEEDALHVALAAVAECSLLVSWNFKHIVHVEKVPRYNAVNMLRGHRPVQIHAPPEVIAYEKGL